MKCYKHTDRDAVAICGDCRRGLCSECASRYVVPVCDFCVEKARSFRRKDVRNYFLCFYVGMAAVVALFLFGLIAEGKLCSVFLGSYSLIFVPFAYRAFILVKLNGCAGFLLKLLLISVFVLLGFPFCLLEQFFKIKNQGDGMYNGSGWRPALRFLLKNVYIIVGFFAACFILDVIISCFSCSVTFVDFGKIISAYFK